MQWARFQHLCRHCKKCTMDEATCPTRALKLYGKSATIEELVVPGCTEDMPARYAYLDSIGIARKDVVELEYFDYARSKYKALGIPDTMPGKKDPGSEKGKKR